MLSKYRASTGWSRKDALDAFGAVESDLQTKYPALLYSDLLSKVHEVMEQRLKAASGAPVDTSTLDGNPSTVSDSAGASTSDHSAPAPLTDDHVRFGKAIKDWPMFSDSSAALHALSKHYKLVVLSNVDRSSFAYTLANLSEGGSTDKSESYLPPESKEYWLPQQHNPGTKSPFTLILTAQDVQSYKPSLHGFKVALDVIHQNPALLCTPKEQVLWVAQSLFHDIEPATRLGLSSVFIDREGATLGSTVDPEPAYSWKFKTLGEMAEAVEKEL